MTKADGAPPRERLTRAAIEWAGGAQDTCWSMPQPKLWWRVSIHRLSGSSLAHLAPQPIW